MGGKLSTSRRPPTPGCQIPYNFHTDDENAESSGEEIVNPICCRVKVRKKKEKKKKKKKKNNRDEVGPMPDPLQKKVKISSRLTLQEWILSSPGTDQAHDTISSGASLPPGVMQRDGEGGEESDCLSISKTESGRSKKKVSFRLPEETDSIMIYTPSPEDQR